MNYVEILSCQVYKRWQSKLEPRWTNHTEWEAMTCIWVGSYCLISSFFLIFFFPPNICTYSPIPLAYLFLYIILHISFVSTSKYLNIYYKGGTIYLSLGLQRTTEMSRISLLMELKGLAGEKH